MTRPVFGMTGSPRAMGVLAVLAVHGAAWALVWQAMAPHPAASPSPASGPLVYLWSPEHATPQATRPATRPAAELTPRGARATRPAPESTALNALTTPALSTVVATAPTTPATTRASAPALAADLAPRLAPTAPPQASAATASSMASTALTPVADAPLAARALPGNALPAYPEAAREDGLQGRVQLQLSLDAQGRVVDVQWLQRSGIALLDLAARDAVRRWRYEPARRGGEAVASTVSVAIRFQLDAPVSAAVVASR